MKVLVALKHLTPVSEETKPASTPAVQSPKRRNGGDSEVKRRTPMAANYLHGVETIEVENGARPVKR